MCSVVDVDEPDKADDLLRSPKDDGSREFLENVFLNHGGNVSKKNVFLKKRFDAETLRHYLYDDQQQNLLPHLSVAGEFLCLGFSIIRVRHNGLYQVCISTRHCHTNNGNERIPREKL